MTRVVLMSGTDRGHTYPTVAVALALRDRGHDVLVVTGARRGLELDAAGVDWTPIPEAEPHEERRDLSQNLWSWAAAAARPTASLLERCDAEVVVSDVLMAAGGLAAELRGVPWVQLVPHHLSDQAVELPPMGLGRHPSRRPWVRADDRLIHHRAARSIARGRDDRRAARRGLGLTGSGRPAARLIASLPGLEYPRRTWPVDAHLVGPLTWDPPAVGVAPWPGPGHHGAASVDQILGRLDPDGPPVVVATDSTGTGASGGLAALTVEALAGLEVQLVAITQRREVALEASQRWPLGCVVASVPHHHALDLASVAVAPGGAGFLGKALVRGVPLVLVPDFGDQLEAAARVTWAGAGRRVDLRMPWTPWLPDPVGRVGQLRRAVVRVLADGRYRSAAQQLAASAAQLGPPRAAAIVEQVVAGTLPDATGPVRS
ncbi:MAG: nucleotide disphospho-sugar-binding domain-containing protein [Nitriliruptor sp.]